MERALHALLDRSAQARGAHTAVVDPRGRTVSYGELADSSDQLRSELCRLGIGPGERVGTCLRKSIDAVAALFGILKTGAAYVPVDATGPLGRAAYILNDCGVRVVLCEEDLRSALGEKLRELGNDAVIRTIERRSERVGLGPGSDERSAAARAATATVYPGPTALAYVLYTSGSTGRPKGVMLTHECALSYVDWCSRTFDPVPDDRFASHAPFHFDLSILDLYVSIKHGATLVLIDEETGKEPLALAPIIAASGISVWYSTPSILNMLAQYGRLERHDHSALRLVLFAGEVFPVAQLRRLKSLWPRPRYYNLYGPTETNVCTYYEIPESIPAERSEPFPIGRTCSHLQTMVADEGMNRLPPGVQGELMVAGPAVMVGYWNLPELDGRAFLTDGAGGKWYRTGDLVQENAAGEYTFLGRRDRMVKRRGYRVELGEIEAGLASHRAIREVAVVAIPDERAGVRIRAYLSCLEGRRPTLIELKTYCVEHLPGYMVPDVFSFVESLPRTSTAKVDYQTLVMNS